MKHNAERKARAKRKAFSVRNPNRIPASSFHKVKSKYDRNRARREIELEDLGIHSEQR